MTSWTPILSDHISIQQSRIKENKPLKKLKIREPEKKTTTNDMSGYREYVQKMIDSCIMPIRN